MNRLPASTICLICCARMDQDPGASEEAAASLARQISQGMCDDCQRKRNAAAIEYVHACNQARLEGWAESTGWTGMYGHELSHRRVRAAAERCVQLRMWSAEQQTEIPEQFRERRGTPCPSPSRRVT